MRTFFHDHLLSEPGRKLLIGACIIFLRRHQFWRFSQGGCFFFLWVAVFQKLHWRDFCAAIQLRAFRARVKGVADVSIFTLA